MSIVGVEVNIPDVSVGPETLNFMQRILGPFAEAGDFLSEKIRYFRWKSSIKVMSDAQRIAKENGISPAEIPLKILVPLLEKASLEEEESPLLSTWAQLLASAANNSDAVLPVYTDILAKLTHEDVTFLERLVSDDVLNTLKSSSKDMPLDRRIIVTLAVYHDAYYARAREKIVECCQGRKKGQYRTELSEIADEIIESQSRVVETLVVKFFPFQSDDIFRVGRESGKATSIDVAVSSGLATRRQSVIVVPGGEVFMNVVIPTPMGLKFVAACRGDELPVSRA